MHLCQYARNDIKYVHGVRYGARRAGWRPRQWGACWLVLKLWQALGLDEFRAGHLEKSRQGTRSDHVLFELVVYRLIAPGSEWRLHRQWFERTALADLLGTDSGVADIHKLYACHDYRLAHKTAVFDHLVRRWPFLTSIKIS